MTSHIIVDQDQDRTSEVLAENVKKCNFQPQTGRYEDTVRTLSPFGDDKSMEPEVLVNYKQWILNAVLPPFVHDAAIDSARSELFSMLQCYLIHHAPRSSVLLNTYSAKFLSKLVWMMGN